MLNLSKPTCTLSHSIPSPDACILRHSVTRNGKQPDSHGSHGADMEAEKGENIDPEKKMIRL